MKKGNRGCELQLRDAELLLAAALALDKVPSADVDAVRRQLAEAWRLLLVNQFHDVLPGSSIELVHQEAKVFIFPSFFRNLLLFYFLFCSVCSD